MLMSGQVQNKIPAWDLQAS